MDKVVLSKETERQTTRLFRRLGSGSASQRLQARQSFQGMEPESVPFLLYLLHRNNRCLRTVRLSIAFVAGIALAVIVIDTLNGGVSPEHSVPGMLLLFALMAGLVRFAPTSQQQREILLLLRESEEVRVLGFLIEALEFRHFLDENIRRIAADALVHHLGCLSAEDFARLTGAQRGSLRRALRSEHVGLVIAVLDLLERVGNPLDIGWVEPLAESWGPASRNPQVRQKARECLCHLQERAARLRDSEQLLRASVTEFPAEELLRGHGAGEVHTPHR